MNNIEDTIKKIGIAISELANENEGLFLGTGGPLLFFSYYSKFTKNQWTQSFFDKYYDICLNAISNGVYNPSFCDGAPGLIYLLNLLNKEGLIEVDLTDVWKFYDKYIHMALEKVLIGGEVDFLYTGAGLLYYFANRDYVDEKAINHYVDLIEDCSIKLSSGITWKDKFNDVIDIKYNISLSHGSAGLIMALILLWQRHKSHLNSKLPLLINQAISFVLSQKNSKEVGSCFPAYCKEFDRNRQSRLGWCNGDLGVALALWYAGKIFNNTYWENEALKTFIFDSSRRKKEETSVEDAYFCHGTSGIAQIYKRLYYETNIPLFKETHDYWINRTIEIIERNLSECTSSALLTGVSGIGLTLLASAGNINYSSWDKVFLISI